MGLLNSALQIGRSAILGYQSALQVVGSNISSAGSPDYTRLTPGLDPLQGPQTGRELQPGAGVALTSIQRNIDEALEGRVRLAIGTEASAVVQRQSLARLESLFSSFDGTDLGTRIGNLLRTFDELQNTPEDVALRDLALASAVNLANAIQDKRRQIGELSTDLNARIADLIVQADDLASRIADLNEEVTRAEAGRSEQASGLRDQRDALLRDLSELFDVTVREQSNGVINVYIGSEALVQGNQYRRLMTTDGVVDQSIRTAVVFADTKQEISVAGGQIGGLVLARDQHGIEQVAALDRLAAALITEVNRIHADGQGLEGIDAVTGSSFLLATDLPLNSAEVGLTTIVRSGSFYITVADDATATPLAYRINVDLDDPDNPTTLESLVAAINDQVTGMTAAVTLDSRLSLTADAGFSFTFGHDGQQARADTSGVLAALGINTFFTGEDASDIAVNGLLVNRPSLMALSSTFQTGDGTIARALAALDTTGSEQLGGVSVTEFYNSLANTVAVAAGAGETNLIAAETIMASLQAQRDSISGVNLDEEAISLLKYQRAFQGAARFVSVVDELISELLLLVR